MNTLYKSVNSLNQQKLTLNRIAKLYSTTSSVTADKIEIPKRIPRSSTDILNALASTVGHDPTAAHYKYHDDPFLIPMSNIGKRTFAMAQEAGRKAAKWIKQEHQDFFMVNFEINNFNKNLINFLF